MFPMSESQDSCSNDYLNPENHFMGKSLKISSKDPLGLCFINHSKKGTLLHTYLPMSN